MSLPNLQLFIEEKHDEKINQQRETFQRGILEASRKSLHINRHIISRNERMLNFQIRSLKHEIITLLCF